MLFVLSFKCCKLIFREIDEVLRPGVYALIDACSADDLQYLHSVFGGQQLITLKIHAYRLSCFLY